jgi:hypothetical protein
MNLLKHTLAVLVIGCVFLHLPVTAQPMSLSDDWKTVSSRTPDEVLTVKLKNGTKVKGKLRTTSERSILLVHKGRVTEIQRTDVAWVAIAGDKRSAVRPALIGAGIGAGAGAAVGAAVTRPKPGDINVQAAGAVIFGVIGLAGGGVAGYLTGRTRHKETRIYEAPETRNNSPAGGK